MYDARVVGAAYTYCAFLGRAQPVHVTNDRTWNVICRRKNVELHSATVCSLISLKKKTSASRTASIPYAITWAQLLTETTENRPCQRLSYVRFQNKMEVINFSLIYRWNKNWHRVHRTQITQGVRCVLVLEFRSEMCKNQQGRQRNNEARSCHHCYREKQEVVHILCVYL